MERGSETPRVHRRGIIGPPTAPPAARDVKVASLLPASGHRWSPVPYDCFGGIFSFIPIFSASGLSPITSLFAS